MTDVADYFEGQHGIPVEIDERSLAAARIASDVPCTLEAKGVTLADALNRLLGNLGLTYVVEDEYILIVPRR